MRAVLSAAPPGRRPPAPAGLLVGGLALVLAGCSSGPTLPPLVPVKGQVTVDGKPLTGGQVVFLPVAAPADQSQVPSPAGQVDGAGNYELFTAGQAGAPAGKYKVTVNPSMVPTPGAKGMPKAPFDERYRQEKKTPLQIDVPAGPFDLKLKS